MGEGKGEVRKGENIPVRETVLNERNSCTPSITPKNIQKIHTKEMLTKKIRASFL